ncbi:MAG: arginine--tRNA ligase [Actinobacteria bacterium]|nr:arginine--tRNA ligase [Actinomycetota bacterium]
MSAADFLDDFTSRVAGSLRPLLSSWGGEALAGRIMLERPAARGHGDLATSIAMIAAGAAKLPPAEIARKLIDEMRASDQVMEYCEKIEVAGPGFINFFLTGGAIAGAALEALARGRDYGRDIVGQPEGILLEYVSANPTGPLHVGHARYAAYGDSLKRILSFAGHRVTSEFYINDYGSQMDIFGLSLAVRYAELWGRSVQFPEEGYQGDYTIHIAQLIKDEIGDSLLADSDPEPGQSAITFFRNRGCELVLGEVRAVLERFGVVFDEWFSEASLYDSDAVPEAMATLTEAGELSVRDGASWLLTTRHGDDKDRVLIRSSGEPTYFASDIAYHQHKLSRGHDRLINIWGADHHGYVARMKAAFTALGHDPEKLEIIIGQLVNVVELGERKQMSKRRGTMVSLEELVDSIGVDAARFYLVDRSADSTLDLDLEKAKLKSEENPVYYVQYAHARICSILKRSEEAGADSGDSTAYVSLESQERELVMKLAEFPRTVMGAADSRGPQRLTAYSRELAATYHAFYHNCPVLKAAPDAARFRLDLCRLTRNVIAQCLELVGVAAPESM